MGTTKVLEGIAEAAKSFGHRQCAPAWKSEIMKRHVRPTLERQREMGGALVHGANYPAVWEKAARANHLGRSFPPLTYTPADAADLFRLEPAPRTVRGARNLI